ncbi:50S ribosomal protein L24, partial [Enterococcus faecalis]|uniref:50S ribosomal protein L24 n=1 Tax=Enterococcus faecalis TaxID=1351 RepID=UPI003CC5214D
KKAFNEYFISVNNKNKHGFVYAGLHKNEKFLVYVVKYLKKHQKQNQAAPQGVILEVEAPIHVTNVKVIDPSTGEATIVALKEV